MRSDVARPEPLAADARRPGQSAWGVRRWPAAGAVAVVPAVATMPTGSRLHRLVCRRRPVRQAPPGSPRARSQVKPVRRLRPVQAPREVPKPEPCRVPAWAQPHARPVRPARAPSAIPPLSLQRREPRARRPARRAWAPRRRPRARASVPAPHGAAEPHRPPQQALGARRPEGEEPNDGGGIRLPAPGRRSGRASHAPSAPAHGRPDRRKADSRGSAPGCPSDGGE